MLPKGEVTAILERVNRHEAGSLAALWLACYDEIHAMASRAVARGGLGPEVQPTLVVHEVFLKLHSRTPARPWENRRHYFGSAARAVLDIMTDATRRQDARGRAEVSLRESWRGAQPAETDPGDDLLASPERFARLGEALAELDRDHPRVAEVVWLRFVGGLPEADVAAIVGRSRRTVQNDWLFAKAILREKLDR